LQPRITEAGEQAQMNEDRMNTPATLENIETILNADPTLNETDRDSLIEDYYSRYFDGVRYVYDGYQD
jgi:riboflavin biosynthesis pyrimidine reductase